MFLPVLPTLGVKFLHVEIPDLLFVLMGDQYLTNFLSLKL